jgi:hypothetical protein
MDALFDSLETARDEYQNVYVPFLLERKAARDAKLAVEREKSFEEARKHITEDLESQKRRSVVLDARGAPSSTGHHRSPAPADQKTTEAVEHEELGVPFDNFDCTIASSKSLSSFLIVFLVFQTNKTD